MTLDELVSRTRLEAPSTEPHALLSTAVRQQRELCALSEELLDYWVQNARAAGCSWTEVGRSLGVSRQAAQQRHSSVLQRMLNSITKPGKRLTGVSDRLTGSARTVALAREEAQLLHHNSLGTEHLLLGMLAEGRGIAAEVLDAAGMTLVATRAAIVKATGCGDPIGHEYVPFSPKAKKVMELSLGVAVDLGHNYVGTEHLLLALIDHGDSLAVTILSDRGVKLPLLRDEVSARLAR